MNCNTNYQTCQDHTSSLDKNFDRIVSLLSNTLSANSISIANHIRYWIKRAKQENEKTNGTHYGKKYCGYYWIFNTYEDFARLLNVSRSTIVRAIKELKKYGIIVTKQLSHKKWNRTNYYTIQEEMYHKYITYNSDDNDTINDPMDDPMYIIYNNNENNKYNKYIYTTTEENFKHKRYNKHKTDDKSKTTQETKQRRKNTNDNIYINNNTDIKLNNTSTDANNTSEVKHTYPLNNSSKNALKRLKDNNASHLVGNNNTNPNTSTNVIKPLKEKIVHVKDMLRTFSEAFPSLASKIMLNKRLSKLLASANKYKFHNNLQEWEKYLRLVKTSKWIMSSNFHLTLAWLAKWKTIDRILGGEFGVSETLGEVKIRKEKEVEKQNIKQTILNSNELENIKLLKIKILEQCENISIYNLLSNGKAKFSEANSKIILEIIDQHLINGNKINQNYEELLKILHKEQIKYIELPGCIYLYKLDKNKGEHEFVVHYKTIQEKDQLLKELINDEEVYFDPYFSLSEYDKTILTFNELYKFQKKRKQ